MNRISHKAVERIKHIASLSHDDAIAFLKSERTTSQEVREVAPRKKNRDVAPTAESGPDKRVLASSADLMPATTPRKKLNKAVN